VVFELAGHVRSIRPRSILVLLRGNKSHPQTSAPLEKKKRYDGPCLHSNTVAEVNLCESLLNLFQNNDPQVAPVNLFVLWGIRFLFHPNQIHTEP